MKRLALCSQSSLTGVIYRQSQAAHTRVYNPTCEGATEYWGEIACETMVSLRFACHESSAVT
jgi:hypothetical protein